MNELIPFIKSHRILCGVFLLLFLCVIIMGVLIVRELSVQNPTGGPADTDAPGTGAVTDAVTETVAVTDTETETAAVTEPPLPYYTAEGDAPYHPSTHIRDYFAPITDFSDTYRIYGAYPDTDSEAFNDYCKTTVTSLMSSVESTDTLREGGGVIVTVDYRLYLTRNVYCAVYTCKHTDTRNGDTDLSVIVLSYNVENDTVYAPLDRYDMTAASEPLAALIRAGYETAFDKCGLKVNTEFLDAVCTPDPSSFVNIAVDAENMYFFTAYNQSVIPELLCAAVPYSALTEYTWAAIEAEKLAQQLPERDPDEQIDYVELPTYDLSYAVPESEMVGDDYFDDAVFIGNSLIVGLQRTVPLNARYFASIGLNVSQVFTKELIPMTSGKTATISDALGTVEFSKVYLMFGINELGWGSIASFISYYGQIIDRVREVNPDALIYVQSILPINEEKWAKSRDFQSCINNYAVATFNQKIVEMCVEKDVAFVNVGEVLTDETGNLYPDATSDGIHIGGIFSTRWVEYLKTHTVRAQES